jgi:hypothetical protein
VAAVEAGGGAGPEAADRPPAKCGTNDRVSGNARRRPLLSWLLSTFLL